MITRQDVLTRARTIWPIGGVPYSQTAYHSRDGYRQDCSGYVSGAWKLSASYNTETLVSQGIMYEIGPWRMLPGDAIGLCGPGTGGDAGHIQLVIEPLVGWSNRIIEQSGGHPGPRERVTDRPANYRVYRYNRIADALPTVAMQSTGDAVHLLQVRLCAYGAQLVADGAFGPLTDSAVRAFQSGHHLDVDGVVGPITWSYL